jgi:hypothetical protein
MRYVEARVEDYDREEAYRIFVTTSLQLAPQNKYLSKSYTELVNPKEGLDAKSGDEIVTDIFNRAGLKFK